MKKMIKVFFLLSLYSTISIADVEWNTLCIAKVKSTNYTVCQIFYKEKLPIFACHGLIPDTDESISYKVKWDTDVDRLKRKVDAANCDQIIP